MNKDPTQVATVTEGTNKKNYKKIMITILIITKLTLQLLSVPYPTGCIYL